MGVDQTARVTLLPLLCLPPAELLAEQSSHYQRHVRRYVRRSSAKHYLTPQPLEINSDVLLARQDSDSATQPPEEGTGDRRSREAMITEASSEVSGGASPCATPLLQAGVPAHARTRKANAPHIARSHRTSPELGAPKRQRLY